MVPKCESNDINDEPATIRFKSLNNTVKTDNGYVAQQQILISPSCISPSFLTHINS